MKVLAIETSTLIGSVALVEEIPPAPPLSKGGEGGFFRLIGESTLSVSVQHSEKLMPAIQRLLQDTAEGGIDLIAVSTGPGSFTGLRIGIACAQGLAASIGKPLVGVPTLQALAMNGLYFPGLVAAAQNAYRGEVYRAHFRTEEGNLVPVGPEGVLPASEWAREIEAIGERILLVGDAIEAYREDLLGLLKNGQVTVAPAPIRLPRAGWVGLLAGRDFSRSEGRLEGQGVVPRYLREPG